MFLAIEIGNTTIALGCFAGRTLKRAWKIRTHPVRTADELRSELHTQFGLEGLSLADVTAAAVSSVVPEAVAPMREALGGVETSVIDSGWRFSYKNGTREPERVGVDRLVNLEAACREKGVPVVVVDSGTATTISVVESGGVFTGGAILPGLALINQTLGARTAQLFEVELKAPERVIGRDTREALQSGVVLGYVEMVDGLLGRVAAELGGTLPTVVVTGGNGELLVRHSRRLNGATYDPQLTLRGIEYLHEARIRS